MDRNSATYVATIGLTHVLHPDFGATGGAFITRVPGSQPKVPVTFRYESDAGPYPIPVNVAIQPSPDHHAIVVDTTNCTLYELFGLVKQANGSWLAGSGAIWSLSSNQLRTNGWTSADAAGLPILPGLVRYDEVLAGHIDHALRFTAPQTRNTYIWPARHFASYLSGSQYPQFGQRFRLKASVDISGFSPHVRVILQALKTYGMILADNGTSWFISGENDPRINDTEMHTLTQLVGADFEAVDEASLMVNFNSAQAGGAAPPPPQGGAPTGWVHIVSKNSGKCLSITGGPAAIQPVAAAEQWTCVGGTNQEFEFTPVSGGYKITVRSSGLQLDVAGGPAILANGALIIQYPFWGGSNEIWNLTKTSDGYFEITAKSSGKAMDVNGLSTADGARVTQWTLNGGANQKWSFVPAS